jgi:hypothetical protein
MKKLLLMGTLVALAAVPAVATQQGGTRQAVNTPHTVHSEMILYKEGNYNGEDFTVETPSSTVRTDWPIRSIAIHPGDRWQVCGRPRFRECIVLGRSVADARQIGIENQIGSARLAPDTPPPAPAPGH